MIIRENCLLAGDSHETSYLILSRKLGKMLQNVASAAVAIGALRVKHTLKSYLLHGHMFQITAVFLFHNFGPLMS